MCTHTHTHSHAHCVLVRMRAHAHLCTHVLTCTLTQAVYGHTHMHLYTHTSLSCTPLHTIPHTCLPRQSDKHTHTFTAWTLISHTHPHPHTHIQTPAVAPGPIPPCQAQAQPTHCETNTGAQGPLGIRPHRAPPGKSCGKEQRGPPGTAAAPQDTHAATTRVQADTTATAVSMQIPGLATWRPCSEGRGDIALGGHLWGQKVGNAWEPLLTHLVVPVPLVSGVRECKSDM